MRKIISFMHMSLDGFVAGPQGELDWVKVDEELFDHVAKRVSGSNTALYGRNTFEMMESYWPTAGDKPNAGKHDIEHSRWYNSIHKIVLSKSMSGKAPANTTVISDNLATRIKELKQKPGKEILIFGSPTATHSLILHNLVDGYWLFVNPIILGKGIPLFSDISEPVRLNLLPIGKRFTSGVTELNYETDLSPL